MIKEDTIDYNVRNTWNNFSKLYNKIAMQYMGSMALAMIVLNIDPVEGTPSTQLGPNIGIEPTSLSRSIKKLVEMGIIKKVYNQKDKRKTLIKLTDFGIERKEISKKTVLEINQKIYDEFSKDEIYKFITMMTKINKILKLEQKIIDKKYSLK